MTDRLSSSFSSSPSHENASPRARSRTRPARAAALGCALIAASLSAACGSAPAARGPEGPQTKVQAGGAAEVLFDEAVALADAGKLEEACRKFEDSERLEHASGTLVNLADCYEKTGRFASAWEAFNKVAIESKQAGKTARAEEARSRAEALKPRISKLVIEVPPEVAGTPGLTVKRNGAVVESILWGQNVPVDAGEHTVVATAPGKAAWRETISVREAGSASVKVAPLEEPSMSGQRVAAIAVGGVGIAGLIVGGVVGGLAAGKWGDAVDACKGPAANPTACPTEKNKADAAALGSEASTLATVSTIGLAVGGAGVVAAGVLWFLAPRNDEGDASASMTFVPSVSPAGAFGAVRGRF